MVFPKDNMISIRGIWNKVNKTENLFDCFGRDGLKWNSGYGMMILVGFCL